MDSPKPHSDVPTLVGMCLSFIEARIHRMSLDKIPNDLLEGLIELLKEHKKLTNNVLSLVYKSPFSRANVTNLDLSGQWIGNSAFKTICLFKNLTSLNLGSTAISEKGIQDFFKTGAGANLRSLNLSSCSKLTSTCVKYACASAPGLTSVYLANLDRLTHAIVEPLGSLQNLHTLDLSGAKLMPAGSLNKLLRGCSGLKILRLERMGMITQLMVPSQLESLNLGACARLQRLWSTGSASSLRRLRLAGCRSFDILRSAFLCRTTNIRFLCLKDTEIAVNPTKLARWLTVFTESTNLETLHLPFMVLQRSVSIWPEDALPRNISTLKLTMSNRARNYDINLESCSMYFPPNLKKLTLEGLRIHAAGTLLQLVKDQLTKLEFLNVAKVHFLPGSCPELLHSLTGVHVTFF